MPPFYVEAKAAGAPLWCAFGQSNCAQQGLVSGLAGGDIGLDADNTLGKFCRRIYSDESATVPADLAWGTYQCTSGKIGFEMAFARRIAANSPTKAHHLAKWAVGGSDLQWWTDNAKFDEAAAWFLSQQALLLSTYGLRTFFAGLIMIQGESGPTTGWTALAQAGIARMRSAMGRQQLPLIVVQTHISLGAAVVHDAQDTLTAADRFAKGKSTTVQASIPVDTDSYTLNSNTLAGAVHWSEPEINRIGEDVADVARSIFI